MSLNDVVINHSNQRRSNLEKMLTLCAKPLPPEEPDEGENLRELRELQRKSLHDVIHELVRQVTSPNNHVREQAMGSLRLLAEIQGKSVTAVMEPHKEVLQVGVGTVTLMSKKNAHQTNQHGRRT